MASTREDFRPVARGKPCNSELVHRLQAENVSSLEGFEYCVFAHNDECLMVKKYSFHGANLRIILYDAKKSGIFF